MKKLISLLLTLVMILALLPAAHAAEDEAEKAAQTLYELGLFKGTGTNPDGTPIFDLDKTPTRNQAIIMLVRLLGKEEEALAGEWDIPFADVTESMRPYIGYAYCNGLTNGTSATTYSGTNPIKPNQYITFVLRALGYTSGEDFQVPTAWEFSDEIGLTDGAYSAATKIFTRGDVAQISCDALSVTPKASASMLIQKLVNEAAVDAQKAQKQGFSVTMTDVGIVHYLYDIRTFTMFAFMNYTGYDDNNGRPITGVRQQLREELNAMNLSLSSPNYYREKKVADSRYVSALRELGDAPTFKYLPGRSDSQLRDLPQKLQEFYEKANVAELYEKYRPIYEKELAAYRPSTAYIAALLNYFRMTSEDGSGEFGVAVNPLFAYERGSGLGSVDKYYGYPVMLIGPSNKVNTLNVVHEYCHGFSDKIIDRHGGDVRAISKHHKTGTKAESQGYKEWDSIVKESFVRAFSGYFTPGYGKRYVQDEVQKGFTMTEYIYDRIPEFESFGGDIEDFMVKLLKEYRG